MRLWQLLYLVVMAAFVFAVGRDEVGRVALVVFVTGLGEVALGLVAIMTLFRTLGAFGEAQGLAAHLEAVLATLAVLLVASLTMNGLLWLGIRMMLAVVR